MANAGRVLDVPGAGGYAHALAANGCPLSCLPYTTHHLTPTGGFVVASWTPSCAQHLRRSRLSLRLTLTYHLPRALRRCATHAPHHAAQHCFCKHIAPLTTHYNTANDICLSSQHSYRKQDMGGTNGHDRDGRIKHHRHLSCLPALTPPAGSPPSPVWLCAHSLWLFHFGIPSFTHVQAFEYVASSLYMTPHATLWLVSREEGLHAAWSGKHAYRTLPRTPAPVRAACATHPPPTCPTPAHPPPPPHHISLRLC